MRGSRRLLPPMPATMVVVSVMFSTAFVVRGVERLRRGPSAVLSEPFTLPKIGVGDLEGRGALLGKRVLARNIFDSQTGPMPWVEAPPPAADEPAEDPAVVTDGPIERCEGDLRLHASIVNDADPSYSFAALRKGQETTVVQVGDDFDGMKLLALRPALAYLQGADGRACKLPIFLAPDERGGARPAPPKRVHQAKPSRPERKPPPSMFSEAELDKGIRPLGGDRYAVSRAMVEQAMKNPRKVAQGGRLRPFTRNGKTVGLRAMRIKPGTVLDRLGVKNGDVVRKINGFDLASPDGMLSALSLLKQQDTFTLAIERGGKPRDLQFRLE